MTDIKILSVGTNMHKARVYLKKNGYNAEERQNILDRLRADIPNARLRNCKFLMGVSRIYLEGGLSDAESIMSINNALRYIADDSHVNEYDFNLNGETANTISNRFKSVAYEDARITRNNADKRANSIVRNDDYEIIPIETFEDSSQYAKYTSWCITQSKGAFESYTYNGLYRFYFCIKKGFENVEMTAKENAPLDEYGLSMIAVSVGLGGELSTITCRWNHDNEGNDSVMSIEQLENTVGRPFFETFIPYTFEELKAKGKYVSKNIGKYYLDMNTETEGIIVSVNEDDSPKMIMEINDDVSIMEWNEAMEYVKTLKNGWHIPSSQELNDVWTIKGYNNPITLMISKGFDFYNKNIYEKITVDNEYVYWENPFGDTVKYDINKPVII